MPNIKPNKSDMHARLHPNLAVGDPAGGAGVLPPHTAGRLALLEKPLDPLCGLSIDHQHPIRVGQRLHRVIAHHVAQRIRVPAPTPQDRLLAPGARITRRLGAHPPGLAPFRPEQAIQEQPRLGRHALLRKQRSHPPFDVSQRRGPKR